MTRLKSIENERRCEPYLCTIYTENRLDRTLTPEMKEKFILVLAKLTVPELQMLDLYPKVTANTKKNVALVIALRITKILLPST